MGKRKVKVGQVVSDKMDKTVVVVVETLRHHPLYKKTVRHTKKYKAHDGDNECKIGDKVRIMEVRPLSKEKRWRIVEVISRKEAAEPEPELNDSDSNQA
jgi:small subunit ribosomal protein S17